MTSATASYGTSSLDFLAKAAMIKPFAKFGLEWEMVAEHDMLAIEVTGKTGVVIGIT